GYSEGPARYLRELNGLLELVEDSARSSQDALDAAGAEYELLDAPEARARWPVCRPGGWPALFQPEAGIVRADVAHRAFVDCALARGVRLEEGRHADSIEG